jgi:Gpi18-like mannosyltransferase
MGFPDIRSAAGVDARKHATWVGAGLVLALLVRWSLLDYVTGDLKFWVTHWYDYLQEHGYRALAHELPADDGWENLGGSYPPTYYYLLWFAGLFHGLAPKAYLIKAVSIAFDFLAATFAYKILRLHPTASSTRAWVAFFAVLFAPTLVVNGAFWGQCDAIHVSLLLGAVYFALAGRSAWTAVCFGIAVSIKAQSVFLLPFLLILVVRGAMPLWQLLLVPATYAVVMAPAVLIGRPILEIVSIYRNQGAFLRGLSLNAPNLYFFIDNAHYDTVVPIGVAVTCLATLAVAWRARRVQTPSRDLLLLCAVFSVAMAPSLLPKMHDRYFMAADLSSIVLAVWTPELWLLPLGFQVMSGLAYVPVVSDSATNFGGEITRFGPVAAALNLALMTGFTWVFLRKTRRGADAPYQEAVAPPAYERKAG